DLFRTGPVAIAVLNPSFELQEPAEKTLPCPGSGCWYADDSVTYWDISGYDNEDHIPMTAGKTGFQNNREYTLRVDRLPEGLGLYQLQGVPGCPVRRRHTPRFRVLTNAGPGKVRHDHCYRPPPDEPPPGREIPEDRSLLRWTPCQLRRRTALAELGRAAV